MGCKIVPFLFVYCASVVVMPYTSHSQSGGGDTSSTGIRSVREITQALAARGPCIGLPAKGKVKRTIKRDAPSFLLPGGESPVLLFKLPDYTLPYTLTVTSPCNYGCFGFSKSIFAPSGIFFDSHFEPTRELPSSQFENLNESLTKSRRLETTILINELRREDRYLLLYTMAGDVGEVVHIGERSTIQASTYGSVELSVQPAHGNPFKGEAEGVKDGSEIQEAAAGQFEAEKSEIASETAAPSAQSLIPEPELRFPVQALEAFAQSPRFKNFDFWISEGGEYWLLTMARNPRLQGFGSGSYQFQAGFYNVLAMTPILEWYLAERDTIRLKKKETKRREKLQGTSDVGQIPWDWSSYENKLRKAVHVMVIPDFCQTTLSLLLSGVAKEVTQLKYKASFSEMSLLCDGKEIPPIGREKFQVRLPEGYGTPEGEFAFAGTYEYPFDAFDRHRCHKLELRIVSEGSPDRDIKAVPRKIIKRVWADFESFQTAALQP